MQTVKVTDLVVDPTINVREKLVEQTVLTYMDSWDQLPPITVFKVSDQLIVTDGFHRTEAARRLALSEIDAEVRTGTRAEAAEHAATANIKHGTPLTRTEKVNAASRLMELHPKWSNPTVAKKLGVGESFVRKLREAARVKNATGSVGMSDSIYTEIAHAPQKQWEALTNTAQEKGWTRDEARNAVQTLKSKEINDEYKRDLLNGKAEPVVVKNGRVALGQDTITRHMREVAGDDPLTTLHAALEAFARFERVQNASEDVFGGLKVDRAARLAEQISHVERQLAAVRKRLKPSKPTLIG